MAKKNKMMKDNKGSAIITGLVVSTVLLVLCLSLLAVAYSLFLATKNNTSDISEREMLYSAADVIESELLSLNFETKSVSGADNTVTEMIKFIGFESISGENTSSSGGTTSISGGTNEENDFWNKFIEYVVDDYKKGKTGEADTSRYYSIKAIGSAVIVMHTYWVFPDMVSGTVNNDINAMNGAILHCNYTLYNTKGELICKTEKAYKLQGEKVFAQGNTNSSSGEETTGGKYTLNFENGDNDEIPDANSYFLPKSLHFDTTKIPTFNQMIETVWYKDENCEEVWDGTFDSLNYNPESSENQSDAVFTKWELLDGDGQSKPPLLIEFFVWSNKENAWVGIKKEYVRYKTGQQLASDKAPKPDEIKQYGVIEDDFLVSSETHWYYHNSSYMKFFNNTGFSSNDLKEPYIEVFGVFEKQYYKSNGQLSTITMFSYPKISNYANIGNDGQSLVTRWTFSEIGK